MGPYTAAAAVGAENDAYLQGFGPIFLGKHPNCRCREVGRPLDMTEELKYGDKE